MNQELQKIYEKSEKGIMAEQVRVLEEGLKRLSEGYELQLELQDSPELASLFGDMFGLDLNQLLGDAPKSLKDYYDKLNELVSESIRDYKSKMELAGKTGLVNEVEAMSFDIMSDKDFNEWGKVIGADSPYFKTVSKAREELINLRKKAISDLEQDYNR